MQSGVETFTGLRHFVGVVEDRNDPEKIGRVKVRIYSIHTEDKTAIPTEELPWAMVLNGTNSASSSRACLLIDDSPSSESSVSFNG